VLEEAGAKGALEQALSFAGLSALPPGRELVFKFIEGPLREALVGMIHPATAAHALESMRERIAEVDRSGTRVRSDSTEIPQDAGTPTLPPPADPVAAHEYDDLVSGAVHSRITPTWGMRAVDPSGRPGESVWAVVSTDGELARVLMSGAPAEVDVVVASSMAELRGALERGGGGASAVVIDAADPSMSVDRAIATLTSDAMGAKVILWRMEEERRAKLLEAIPHARRWLPCDREVTPREILQLLSL